MRLENGMRISFTYKNWKGETSKRTVFVYGVEWDSNKYHPEAQWLLFALDLDKAATRHFAMKDMSKVEVIHNGKI